MTVISIKFANTTSKIADSAAIEIADNHVAASTQVISMMHMVFDYLAFKNDVGFFRARKDYTGISGRTLLSSFVCSVVGGVCWVFLGSLVFLCVCWALSCAMRSACCLSVCL